MTLSTSLSMVIYQPRTSTPLYQPKHVIWNAYSFTDSKNMIKAKIYTGIPARKRSSIPVLTGLNVE